MIAAIILAAGGSSRMGQPKQLLTYRGTTLLRRTIDAALGGGCRPVIVVLGAHEMLLRVMLGRLPVQFCANEYWQDGLAESIHWGVDALLSSDKQAQAALLMVCDQPFISAGLVRHLCASFDGVRGRMVACEYGGTVGVPALFEASCFDSLAALKGDEGAKSVLLADPGMLLRHPWPEGACDIDTPEDYEKLE